MADKSLLRMKELQVTPKITLNIPSVGDILDDEGYYYWIVNSITQSPYSAMVELDDMGIDFTTITAFELFVLKARFILSSDLSYVFGDTFSKLYNVLSNPEISDEFKNENVLRIGKNQENGEMVIYDAIDDIIIDQLVYEQIADGIRKINLIEKDNRRPGNDAAKHYLIQKERRYKRRHAKDKVNPYLETLVVALVNKQEFPYNYETVMDLSIYNFKRSLKQIQHTVNFDKVMIGVYAGTVDTSKMADKSILNFIDFKTKTH